MSAKKGKNLVKEAGQWPVNRVDLAGYAGDAPQVFQINGSLWVARFWMGTHQLKKDSYGQWKRITEWHLVIARGHTACQAAILVHRGSFVSVRGKLRCQTLKNASGDMIQRVYVSATVLKSNLAA